MRSVKCPNCRRWCSVLGALLGLLSLLPALLAADLVPIEPLGLRIARGFRVTLWADADLANDIHAMTLNARGQVMVTGPGYIKTLVDSDGNGLADMALDYATVPGGGEGLAVDGGILYCVGEGGLFRYADFDQDGEADGPPEVLHTLDTSEHGAHSIRKGPDGAWYLIAGNEIKVGNEQNLPPPSPVRRVEAGALFRLPGEGRILECVADGFRNPADFDFNWLGDAFTFDSDLGADVFLPWYAPARLFHIGHAAHHGWRLNGWKRGFPRPDYYPDAVDILAPMGHAQPSGAVVYRHYQFPLNFRNGLFVCDWNSGRIYFTPLVPEGTTYQAAPEVFLEPIGLQGFAPSDIVVTPEGSLLVSTGGRKTRGGVFRIDFPPAGPPALLASNWIYTSLTEVEAVLNAPQPQDAWSRAWWVPIAQRLGPAGFAQVVGDNRLSPSYRVRAVEILTELFGGLIPPVAVAGAQANSPFVRARTAWSLGRVSPEPPGPVLLGLARDAVPAVRRCALEAIGDHAARFEPGLVPQALAANLTHPDKRVRQAAVRLATLLPEPDWNAFWTANQKAAPDVRLASTLALLQRSPGNSINVGAIESALAVLAQSGQAELRRDAVRLIILALGDYRLNDPSQETYATYEPAILLHGHETLVAKLRRAISGLLPSGDASLDFEAARLLAMLEDDSPETPARVLSLITDRSAPSADFHYLTVLSRLRGPDPTNAPLRVARALLLLDRKLAGQQRQSKQNWSVRLAELTQNLLHRDPKLADALLRDPNLPSPAHVPLVSLLGSERYLPAARLFLAAVKRNPRFPWSGPLVDLLSALPLEEVRPLLRQQWYNLGLRDEVVLKLAQKPELADRDRFMIGLGSLDARVTRACLSALMQLPRDPSGKALIPALRLLRRLMNEPSQPALRAQVLLLLSQETGQKFRVQELGATPEELRRAYQPVFAWFQQRQPALLSQADGDARENPSVWALRFKAAPWERGVAVRGEALFRDRGCQLCHAGSGALGPDLGGAASRLSPVDLFNAIVFPNREVAAAYRNTVLRTHSGQTLSGLVISDTPSGVILQTSAATTVRLAESEIASRQLEIQSLMPTGLLNGLKSQELADLYAYLRALPAGAR